MVHYLKIVSKVVSQLEWGQDLPKIESLEGGRVQGFLLERGDKPLKEGLMQKWRGCHFFITLQFNHIYCVWGESKIPFITFQIFSLLSQPFKILIQVFIVLKPNIICTILIHYGSVQKMLTEFFNFVWNLQKNQWTIFFECTGKMFLSTEKVLKKISEDQP